MKIVAPLLAFLLTSAPALALNTTKLDAAVRAEETRLGAKIGAAVLDTKDKSIWSYHGDDLFPLMSTHKTFSCGQLLAKVDKNEASLAKRVVIVATDLEPNSPVTEKHIAPEAMSLGDLCAAAIGYSDNTAANFILAAIGGPGGVTAMFRALGDETSRLDRTETDLNEALPGDPRDTTTPKLAVADLDKLLLGDVLKPTSREQLTTWMVEDHVSGPLLRSAFPESWRVADKTGAGERGSRGIIAVIWPPERAPVVAAVYMRDTTAAIGLRNAAIARIGAALRDALK